MAKEEEVAAHSHADLEKELAAIKKEMAALKKELEELKKMKSSGGADPRVDKLIEALKLFGTSEKQKLEKLGL